MVMTTEDYGTEDYGQYEEGYDEGAFYQEVGQEAGAAPGTV